MSNNTVTNHMVHDSQQNMCVGAMLLLELSTANTTATHNNSISHNDNTYIPSINDIKQPSIHSNTLTTQLHDSPTTISSHRPTPILSYTTFHTSPNNIQFNCNKQKYSYHHDNEIDDYSMGSGSSVGSSSNICSDVSTIGEIGYYTPRKSYMHSLAYSDMIPLQLPESASAINYHIQQTNQPKFCRSLFMSHNTVPSQHNSNTLLNSSLLNSDSVQYKCPYIDCNKSFKKSNAVNRHYKCHTGERPYQCNICARAFAERGNLIRHCKAIHNGIKPFQCEHCKRTFSRNCHLIQHESARITGGACSKQIAKSAHIHLSSRYKNSYRHHHTSYHDTTDTCGDSSSINHTDSECNDE